jgi:hypothetical protein
MSWLLLRRKLLKEKKMEKKTAQKNEEIVKERIPMES